MSSPGEVKVTRPVSPWSKDYHTSVTAMDTNDLSRSTLTDETRGQKGDTGFYTRDRNRCLSTNHIQNTFIAFHRVVKEMKERDTHTKQQGKRFLE
jgi:hypothetical protein